MRTQTNTEQQTNLIDTSEPTRCETYLISYLSPSLACASHLSRLRSSNEVDSSYCDGVEFDVRAYCRGTTHSPTYSQLNPTQRTSIHRSIDPSIDQSIDPSIHRSIDPSTHRSTKTRTNQQFKNENNNHNNSRGMAPINDDNGSRVKISINTRIARRCSSDARK